MILICWFDAQETFIIIISVNSCAASYLFCENDAFYLDSLMKDQKNSIYLAIFFDHL